ncbi:MAG: hypothetical protein IKQ56_00715 [Lachnospiraceae bacterium]|nr:hypothetical protein [Lachnospiraceae bacterium]
MKKGSNVFIGILITIFMAAVITGSMVLGYRFLRAINPAAAERIDDVARDARDKTEETLGINLTPPDPEVVPEVVPENVPEEEVYPERENGIEIVKEPEKKHYAGSRLYESDEYIYNDAGEVLTNFHLDYGLGIDVLFDRDRKYGVILSNNNCFLIEADLSYKQIASNVSYAGINFDGTTIYYSSSSAGLWLHDIETGEETLISDACYKACLSPDGKTIIYNDYAEKNRKVVIIGGIGKEGTVIDVGKNGLITPVAVSDDGNTAYYEIYSGNDNGLYCYSNGEVKRLSADSVPYRYLNRSCEKIVYTDNKKVWYYAPGLEDPVELVSMDSTCDIRIVDAEADYTEEYFHCAIVDVDNLADAVIINSGRESYCLSEDCTLAVQLRDNGYTEQFAGTADGLACVYKDDDCVYKSVYEHGEVKKTVVREQISSLDDITFADGVSEGFLKKYEYNAGDAYFKLYYFKEGEEDVFLADCGKDNFNGVLWDKVFKKCYFTCNGDLISINKDGSLKTTIAADVDYIMDYTYSDGNIGYSDTNGVNYVVINNNVFER